MNAEEPCTYIIDDDEVVRDSAATLLDSVDIPNRAFASAMEFLDFYDGSQRGCLIVDIRMPGMNGLELQQVLKQSGCPLPIIFMTGHGDIPMAVEAMRQGALDFMRKPVREQELLDRVQQALDLETDARHAQISRADLRQRIASLTTREKEIFDRVAGGAANKVIAIDLGISERTVEVHRAQVMKKLEAESLAHLVRQKIEAEPQS